MHNDPREFCIIAPAFYLLTSLVLGVCACSGSHPAVVTPPDDIPPSVVASALHYISKRDNFLRDAPDDFYTQETGFKKVTPIVVSRMTEPLFPLIFMADDAKLSDASNRAKILEAEFGPREISIDLSSEPELTHVTITDKEKVYKTTGPNNRVVFSNPLYNQYERYSCKIGFFIHVMSMFDTAILSERYYWVSLRKVDEGQWKVRKIRRLTYE